MTPPDTGTTWSHLTSGNFRFVRLLGRPWRQEILARLTQTINPFHVRSQAWASTASPYALAPLYHVTSGSAVTAVGYCRPMTSCPINRTHALDGIFIPCVTYASEGAESDTSMVCPESAFPGEGCFQESFMVVTHAEDSVTIEGHAVSSSARA